jgi:pimeloyl-ACP methyl ester carboxylesterase
MRSAHAQPRIHGVALPLLFGLVLAACSTEGPSNTPQPSTATSVAPSGGASAFNEVDCPEEATEGIPLTVTCGYLTVLQNRADPAQGTIQLFVSRMHPAADPRAVDPLLILGADLAYRPLQGEERGWRDNVTQPGFALVADRVGREVITLSTRGVGLSQPSLFCDELEELRTTLPGAGASAGDPAYEDLFLDTVSACRDRLIDQGVDPSAYNLAEIAADVEELRIALGYETWNVEALGTSSVLAFEVLRRYPDHLRSLTLDSPDAPQVDLFSEAIIGTRHAFTRLAERCQQDEACNLAYPELAQTLRSLLTELRATPAISPFASAPEHYQIDDATMIRVLRSTMGTTNPGEMPKRIADSYQYGVSLWASFLREDQVLGTGYTYGGSEGPEFSHGAFYSVLCHDELPFVDHEAQTALVGDEPWYQDAYVDSPYGAVCERWDVGQASADPHHLPASDVPTLIFIGRYDPYAPMPLVAAAAEGLSRSWIAEIPYWTHGILVDEACALSNRNRWIDDPTAAPEMSCLDELPERTFVTTGPPI